MRSLLPLAPLLAALACAGSACGGDPDPSPEPPPAAGDPAPAPDPAPPPSPAPGPEPAPSPGPASTPSLTFERTAAPGCDLLVPPRIPAPVTVRLDAPAGSACGAAISDGTGHVAVSLRGPGGVTRWQVFSPSGARLAALDADPLVPEPEGFHGLAVTRDGAGTAVRVEHVAFAPDGTPRRVEAVSTDPAETTSFRWHLAQDPLGGCGVAFASTSVTGNHWFGVRAHRLDPSGAARWPEPARVAADGEAGAPRFLANGVSRRGDTLVLWQRSAFAAVRWLDPSGAPRDVESWTEHASDLGLDPLAPAALDLVPLLDGGLALRAGGRFTRAYPHLSTESAPLPAWLAERPTSSFRFTRGNRGYAVLPAPGASAPACEQAIELRAPGGALCGRAVFRGGGACTTGAIDQGWDGTVIRQAGAGACEWTFWPRLLGAP